jgi:hypothetical protein
MIRALRQLAGAALGVAAVALPAWAIFHLIRQGSCGDVGQQACPDEVGVWILSLVGAFVALCPAAIFIAGRDRMTGRLLLLGPILALTPLAFVAGIVVSLVGASSDPGSRWIGFVVGGIAALIVLRVIVGVARSLGRTPNLTAHPVQEAAQMQTLASALRQVKQAQAEAQSEAQSEVTVAVQASAEPDPDLAGRLRRLDELHASGLIDDAERRRRRDEILAEI